MTNPAAGHEFWSSPGWWFISVVIVGILVNLISAYLKPWIDARLSPVWGWWRRRSEKRTQEQEALIERLRNDAEERAMYRIAEAKYSILSLVAGVGMFVLMTLIVVVVDAGFHSATMTFDEATTFIKEFVGFMVMFFYLFSRWIIRAIRCQRALRNSGLEGKF